MKTKHKIKKLLVGFMAMTVIPSMVMADNYYWVSGNSMNPTLKNGDVVKVVSKDYKEGDVVIAETKSGEVVVKRIKGEQLVGDGENSTNYKLTDVTILGKVEKNNENSSENVIDATKALAKVDVTSPIEKAYAGAEYVLFLHEDTSITGFGSNVNNVLGMTGGSSKNTGELVKVSDPTGFVFIKAKRGSAAGFRPNFENNELYDVYKIKENVTTKWINEPVRDFDMSHRSGVTGNPHDGNSYIKANGEAYSSGSDYWHHLGVGLGHPYTRYTSGWNRMDSSNDVVRPVFLDWVKNEDNTTTPVEITTGTFTTNGEPLSLEVKYRELNGTYVDTSMTIQILDSNDNVVFTKTNPYRVDYDAFNGNPIVPVYTVPSGTYKLKITSSRTKWDIRVTERKDLKNAKRVLWASGGTLGTFTVVDDQDNIYIHNQDYGNIRKVVFPAGVTIDTKTIVSGDGGHFGALDTDGKVWTWSNTTPTLVSFPNVDSVPFYDKHKILNVAVGGSFTMVISETKDVNKTTEVWVWGSNAYGKLGLGVPTANVNTPTKVTKNGQPLQNIRTITAGGNFSVIVQDTEEGQLVWTAGHNAKGQLGGGVTLDIKEPQLVPGLSGIKEVYTQHTAEVLAVAENQMYSFGGSKSYPDTLTVGNNIGMVKDWVHAGTDYWRMRLLDSPTTPTILIQKSTGIAYGFGGDYRYGLGTTGNWQPIRMADKFIGDVNFGRTNSENFFRNVKGVAAAGYAGALIDENGRIWGWGITGRTGVDNQTTHFDINGARYGTRFAHPMQQSNNEFAPTIFSLIAGSMGGGYAVTTEGKLWYFTSSINPVNASWTVNNVKLMFITAGLNGRYSAIDENGELWSWNRGGTPVKIAKDKYDNKKVVHVAEGTSHTVFVTDDGSVWSIGDNSFGKLGDGTTTSSNIPVKVKNVLNAVKVAAGTDTSYAVDTEGRVWAWGYSAYGSLGNNFSLERTTPSTAVGNDLPEMSILNELKTVYISKNGNRQIELIGTIAEKDVETTKITATMMGVKKETAIQNTDWEKDVYDKVIPKDWNINWDIDEFGTETTFQSLTKVVAEDARGGLIEQFFAGRFIVDNEAPVTPNWGETCILDPNTLTETTCYTNQHFFANGNNGVNNPVRLYINAIQKNKDNAAPVFPQISHRKRQAYGYPPSWTEWEDVVNKNDKGYYIDFFQGFQGETQFKIRAKDEAKNLSQPNNEYRYTIITNAGAEIGNVKAEPLISDNVLSNKLIFDGKTPTGSGLKTYDIKTRIKSKDNEAENPWTDLTPGRATWSGSEITFIDSSEGLLGNEKYEYRLDVENTVAIGAPVITELITNPYMAENIAVYPREDGMLVTVTQDKRNKGTTLYRIVIVDNLTGQVYSEDKSTNNINESVNFDLKDANIPFNIVNNSVQIKLVIKGENGIYHTMTYSEDFTNSPALLNDKEAPKVLLSIPEKYQTIINDGIKNPIDISLFGTDNITLPENLQVQISKDGTNWYGFDKGRKTWVQNYWGVYKSTYSGYEMGPQAGKKIVYFKVRDGAGNVTYANVSMDIIEPLTKDETSGGAVTDNTGTINDSAFTATNEIHTNQPDIKINIPKTGNATEVQFSFDGVAWSPWEKMSSSFTKYIAFPYGEGNKTIFARYKNDYGSVSDINPSNDMVLYTFDEEAPKLQVKTANGTYITKSVGIRLAMMGKDNLSKEVKIQLLNSTYSLHPVNADGTVNPASYVNNTTVIDSGKKIFFEVVGLNAIGFHELNFKITDKAGNVTNETIRIYRK